MPRLTVDPNGEIAPDYALDEHLTYREMIMNLMGITEEQAVTAMLEQWTTKLDARKATWETERADRQREEEEERQRVEEVRRQQEAEAEEAPDTPNQKKSASLVMRDDKAAPSQMIHPPSRFALNKLKEFEYIELSYFTMEACASAAKHDHSVSSDALTFTHINNVVSLKPLTQYRASSKVIPDEDLEWQQMSLASTSLLAHMLKAHWPEKLLQALHLFFYQIINHQWRTKSNGYEVLLIYQARIRREWHRQLKDTEGDGAFNIGNINHDFLIVIQDELDEKRRQKGFAESVSPRLMKPSTH
ncbi:hypothetical protein FPV67DRAFT_1673693 [Lyophyllum atratum]|nr:hypothetical protein FPV67DRAFT_1673693 [Lyophyllum atratum]